MSDNHEEQLHLADLLRDATPEDRRVGEAAAMGFLAGLAIKSTPSHD